MLGTAEGWAPHERRFELRARRRHQRLTTAAGSIALVWGPALGAHRAREAANALVTVLSGHDPAPVAIAALQVLAHRRKHWPTEWPLDETTAEFLALQATRVWFALGERSAVL
jgi:hypothetical protein